MEVPAIQYMIHGNQVLSVIDIGGGYCVLAGDMIRTNGSTLFDSKNDAMYAKLLYELERGKDLRKYKSSKYYKYYIERLKKENPEYLI